VPIRSAATPSDRSAAALRSVSTITASVRQSVARSIRPPSARSRRARADRPTDDVTDAAVHRDDERAAVPAGRQPGQGKGGEVLALVRVDAVNRGCIPPRWTAQGGRQGRERLQLAQVCDGQPRAVHERRPAE
jgi:hypothetical protein